ncbi:hypothetical protein [Coralloluteibacterium thermophilus]|uniref:Uncharacterized protein n=1 Tax=Coralloluteibacterium thermophilum TaxID=2707049 RepID=A0ABV9NHI3_9GAMM
MILIVEDRARFDLEQLPPEPTPEELRALRAARTSDADGAARETPDAAPPPRHAPLARAAA